MPASTTMKFGALCAIALAAWTLLAAGTGWAADAAAPSGMFVSIRDCYLGEDYFTSPVGGLKELGINAIELELSRDFFVKDLENTDKVKLGTDEDAKAFRMKAEKLGVRLCGMLTACDFSKGEPESNVAWVARAVELAGLLGIPVVRIDAAMSREKELNHEERVILFADNLSEVLKRTAGSKVQLGIENHGFQGNNLAFLLNVYQMVGSDRLGSTLDTGNFYWRGYPLSELYGILRVLAPYAKHTHVKSIHYPEDKREIMREAGWGYKEYCCPFDEGDIDIPKVVGILQKAGYQGDICIEDESVGKCDTPAQRAAILKRDVACLKQALESPR